MAAEKKHKTVLVVEDSPTQAMALRLLLEEAGLRVLTAVNGRTGVELAYTYQPEVVVLDLELPGSVNGFEASALISGDYRTEHTTVIILTSHDGEREAEKSKLLGAAKFIHKDNFAHQRLLEELQNLRVLESRSGAETP